MKQSIKNFLEFNGKAIYFLSKDGQYWVAVKPICEALGVNFDRQYKNIKSDEILKDVYAIQPMRDTLNRMQNMVSLPEKFVYGWLFGIQSKSPELIKYKWKCYEVLYDYFKGSIGNREELLKEKKRVQDKIATLEVKFVNNDDYREMVSLKAKDMRIGKQLKESDKDVIDQQYEMWQTDPEWIT